MSKKAAPKSEAKSETVKSATAPSFKSFIRSLVKDGIPRGLKVAKNEVGGYTFTSGPKSAPICVIASTDELAEHAISMLGMKLVKAS